MSEIFNSEGRILGGKRELVPGEAETLTAPDFNVRVKSLELSELDVGQSEDSKSLTGDHTHDATTSGVARATFDSSIKFALGEFTATGTPGAPDWARKLTYDKYLEGAGLIVVASDPTDETTEDGYWMLYPNKSADCQTITEAIFDISSCNSGSAAGIKYEIAGAMSTLVIESEKSGAPFRFNLSTKGKVSAVAPVAYTDLPEYNDSEALNTKSPKLLITDVEITKVNQDGSDLPAPNIVSTFAIDGTTPVTTYLANGTTPVTVYDAGHVIDVYDADGDIVLVYDDQSALLVSYDGSFTNSFCTEKITLDTGSTLAEIMCQKDEFGIKQSIITARKPMFNITPLLEKLTAWNFWGAITTEEIYRISVINWKDVSRTVKQLEISAPRTQLVAANGADSNGTRRLEQQFNLLRNVQGADANEKQRDYLVKIYGETVDNTTP